MRHFDTSFLVPLALPEATSEPVARFIENQPADDPAVSHWTRVEFASLLTREVQMRRLDIVAAREAGSRFEAMIKESFVIFLPHLDDFDRAKNRIGRFETGLRAGTASLWPLADCGASRNKECQPDVGRSITRKTTVPAPPNSSAPDPPRPLRRATGAFARGRPRRRTGDRARRDPGAAPLRAFRRPS